MPAPPYTRIRQGALALSKPKPVWGLIKFKTLTCRSRRISGVLLGAMSTPQGHSLMQSFWNQPLRVDV
jgi:hypothetical protein